VKDIIQDQLEFDHDMKIQLQQEHMDLHQHQLPQVKRPCMKSMSKHKENYKQGMLELHLEMLKQKLQLHHLMIILPLDVQLQHIQHQHIKLLHLNMQLLLDQSIHHIIIIEDQLIHNTLRQLLVS
jgi:hypothetical protein